jgi:transcriptional regulator with XRE-family HTH domain
MADGGGEAAHRRAFGLRVRELRKAQSLSQEALADRAGIHRTYMSDLERGGRNVGLDNIYAVAEALGVSPAAFFEDNSRA